MRTAEEFANGHRVGARHAPGGQLVQAADEYVGVRGARIVVTDNDGVRATMTASWLVQLNAYEVTVLAGDAQAELEIGPVVTPTLGQRTAVATVNSADLDGSETIIDLADSLRFRSRGHIRGAWWAVRARLAEAAAVTGIATEVVLTSPDGVLAQLAFDDAVAAWPTAQVRVLQGGTAAWPHRLETGFERATTAPDDVWYKPYDADDQEVAYQHMRDYLAWEIELLDRIERDDTVSFRTYPH